MEPREFFRHTQLIAEVRRHLKSAALRDRFIEGVELFGLQGIEPDFDNNAELKTAFAKVRPELAKSWAAAQSAEYSNAVQDARNTKRGRPAKGTKRSQPPQEPEGAKPAQPAGQLLKEIIERPPLPRHEAPEPEFEEYLKAQGFSAILKAPEPFCSNEIRWLFDWLGAEVASSLLWALENAANKRGKNFWDSFGNCLELCVAKYESCKANFDKSFSRVPFVSELKNSTLSFANYQRLRCRYGRRNVCIKIWQINDQGNFNKGVFDFASVLEKYIKGSIAKGINTKFGLPSFDDSGERCGCWVEGFDKDFDIKPKTIISLNYKAGSLQPEPSKTNK